MSTTADYPRYLETDVVLRSGRTVRIRPIRAEDEPALVRFLGGLSKESLHERFFASGNATGFTKYAPAQVDYKSDFGLVAESQDEIVGVAHYFQSPSHTQNAEVAFAIGEKQRNAGIGTRLLEKLAAIAVDKGIRRFHADVLGDNQKMLDVFLRSGFEVTSRTDGGVVHVSFPIERTERVADAAAGHSRRAAFASMQKIFAPRSIAVVGASRRPTALGTQILRNLAQTGFHGKLCAVNPNAVELEGLPCYPRVSAIGGDVDLVIIAVPFDQVERVIDDAIAKVVSAIVVISAGFGETGETGRAIEARLLEKVRAAGIRMVGPNCMGVLNTDPAVKLHATFSPLFPPRGTVAMSSQSGALGLAALDYAKALNIGFSTFISVGNKTDVSGNDLIQYWSEDPNTDVILLYLESFGNPKKFGEISRRVSRIKPIVAVKAGRSTSGAKAASSHTGALASSDAIADDLFRQAGIIRTDTLEEMFDVATLLSQQPLPRGKRVAILTNAGGPAILAADACERKGLQLSELTPATIAELRSFLPASASVGNPVDMIASASADSYRRALALLLKDENVDAVNAIYIPVLPDDAKEVASAIRAAGQATNGKTLLATFMSAQGCPDPLSPVPAFSFPERAMTALARAAAYGEWRRRERGSLPRFDDIDEKRARAIVQRSLAASGGWLAPGDTFDLLAAASIPVVPTGVVHSRDEALDAGITFGFPVVLKAFGPELLHKTEQRAVRLGLASEPALMEAWEDLHTRLGATMSGAIVQKMVSGGAEAMVGVTDDPTFGHVIAYGAGGTMVELLGDVAFRLHPLTDTDAADLMTEVRFSKVLQGFRGERPLDSEAARDAILRLSALVTVCPEIREIDINPLRVTANGVVVLDARIRVGKPVTLNPSRRIDY